MAVAVRRGGRTQKGAGVIFGGVTFKRLAALVAVAAIGLTACSSSGSSPAASSGAAASAAAGGSAAACGTVNIADNAWVGYEADVAVVAYLLKNELGCTVNIKQLSEQISWQGFPTGEVDVILENWGHEDLAKQYITDQKTAVDLGSAGNTGTIGWYVPKAYADAHPDILTADKDPKVLNKYASDFATSESGGKGQLLDGDPSYVTNDEALVTNLGLDFKVVYSGSEAASDKAIKAAVDAGKPILAYYWEPNWFSTQVAMVHVPLPAYTPGCDADPKKIACDYPPYALNKVASTKFMNSGSPAAALIKNFTWTNEDQNQVATDIALNKMTNDEAAKKWLDAHPDVWKAWLPKS
jgi:glycine betaine/proline transport system substrate-binding protein